jgi:exodeoxyribonuclease-3
MGPESSPVPKNSLRIFSWNVNGLRAAAKKGFGDWIQAEAPDFLGVQEVRALAEDLPKEVVRPQSYFTHFVAAERKGYSGVGMFSRPQAKFDVLQLDDPQFDAEGRLSSAQIGELLIVNGYFPNGNGKDRDNSRVPYKLEFYDRLREKLDPEFRQGRPILVMGDFNTAHLPIDLARPKQNVKTSGFLPEECESLDMWIQAGWVDTFRRFEKSGGHYSWWSQRFGVREKNIGWRIDLILASPGALPFLRGARIHPEVQGSDHCPISVELDPKVLGAV